MKKIAFIVTLVLLAGAGFFYYIQPVLPYDDYSAMKRLTELSEEELKKKRYAKEDILKIESFQQAYNNYEYLLELIEQDTYQSVGYNNREVEEKPGTVEYVSQTNSNIDFSLTILDYFMEKSTEQYKGRLLLEFDVKELSNSSKYYLDVSYPHFKVDSIYTVVRYEQKKDSTTYVDLILELPESNFFSTLSCEIDSAKSIGGEDYLLKSGVVIVDIGSDLMGPDIQFNDGFTATFENTGMFNQREELCKEKVVLTG